jgi:hypothetical protein
LLHSKKWQQEQATRDSLIIEAKSSVAGALLQAAMFKPHSGGNRGGRPKTGIKTGVAAGLKTNKRELGGTVLRRDPPMQCKLAITHRMKCAAADPSAIATHVRQEITAWCGFQWKQCLKWFKKAGDYAEAVTALKLGKYGPRPFGSNLPSYKRPSRRSKGCRLRAVTNTANCQLEVFHSLSRWFEGERQHGHTVTKTMCRDFYMKFLERAAVRCKIQFLAGDASVRAKLTQLEDRVRIMSTRNKDTEKYYDQFVLTKIGAVLRKPQRKTRLSPPEEEQRVQLTWQSIDRAIWTAAFADDETLQQHCPDAVLWHKQLESTIIAMWDHVPVWLKCTGQSKVLFSESETKSWAQRKRLSKKTAAANAHYFRSSEESEANDRDAAVQELHEVLTEAKAAVENAFSNRPAQTRGVYSAGGDKYRVTLILFQAVEHWFSQSATPRGFACIRSWNSALPDLQGILIIHGSVQCRLEDLDDSGRYNRDYQFHSKGKLYDRKKGQSARGLLRDWVKLRSQLGHEQFLKLRVWSQPAAWADEVVRYNATHKVSTSV